MTRFPPDRRTARFPAGLDQDGCTIPRQCGFGFGFCEHEPTDDCAWTFLYPLPDEG